MNVRQACIVRTDIGFSVGLMAAQVAHIHFERIRKMIIDKESFDFPEMMEWMKSPYVFCHGVPNLEALNYFYDKALADKLPVASWHDTVYVKVSETQRIPLANVFVGFSIGPVDSDKVKVVVGDLPLLG